MNSEEKILKGISNKIVEHPESEETHKDNQNPGPTCPIERNWL